MAMLAGQIRALSLVIIRQGQRFLVCPGQDPVSGRKFYRLIGGGIEFGETSLAALKREISEELAVELINYRYLGAVENIFQYNGQTGHEICFIYSADFADKANYQRESLPILDTPDGAASWLEVSLENMALIKPDGALDLLGK